jgi:hypothetical protein
MQERQNHFAEIERMNPFICKARKTIRRTSGVKPATREPAAVKPQVEQNFSD